MKKLFVFLFLFLLPVQPALADTTQANPSVADEVYADLAIRGDLNNISVSVNDNKKDIITINDTKHWIPASTVKLFTAMYAYKEIAKHTYNLYDLVTAAEKNVVPTESVNDGLPTIETGDTITLDRLLRQMITQSDNTAFNMLLDIFDRKAITQYVQSLGLTHSAVGSKLNLDTSQEQYEFDVPGYGINTTTAEDYTKAFTLILQNKIPGAKPLLEVLKQQKINYMLPLYLPKTVVVAHKHGDLDPLYHDGGIVFKEKSPYVVSIFSNAGDPNLIAHLSELIYTQNPKLVGIALKSPFISETDQPIDPLVAEGALPQHAVLGEQTPSIQTVPITAADLGITPKDLSLMQPNTKLPNVGIPADSPLHFFVSVKEALIKPSIFNPKARLLNDITSLQLRVSEAKDLLSRGKGQEASALLQNIQQQIDIFAANKEIKNDAEMQIALQTVSDTRFQILGNALKGTTDNARNALIQVIAQQAKNTLSNVQPNLPLAANATNITQKPLIGEIVDKNDSSLVVKTAGGQQITVSLTDSNLAVKTRSMQTLTEIVLTPSPAPASGSAALAPKNSLASLPIGTTIALIGSSVGSKFTPTFILTHVPKELAAPEPVTVVKVNKENHTMVISENGLPVQVNVTNQTLIKGANTSIGFNQINPGDVVIVHGKPLVPVIPTPFLLPLKTDSITPTTTSTVKTTVSPSLPHNSQEKPNESQTAQSPSVSSSQPSPQSSIPNSKNISSQPSVSNTTHESKTIQIGQPRSSSSSISVPQAPQQEKPQPKVIQSTSIQVIEKKENATKPPTQQKPQSQTEPKKEEQKNTKNQQQTQQPAVQSNVKKEEDKDKKK